MYAGPFTWSTTGAGSYGPGSAQAWEALLRMWGAAPNSQRWQDMMRDFERGQSAFNQVGVLPSAIAAYTIQAVECK
jgi:hypothetical protein